MSAETAGRAAMPPRGKKLEQQEESESEEEEEEEEWTNDHLKLLYMISKYATCAENPEDMEGWIRKNSLLVLMYEGIVEGVFDYDYAPTSLLVGRNRVWLNLSQEGKDDIDDLREGGLLNGLKLSSEDLQPITAYQVSVKGKELASFVPRDFRTEVDNLIYHDGELITCSWDPEPEPESGDEDDDELNGVFMLSTEAGYSRRSEITGTEDVSYVSSPYLPEVLRDGGRATLDNASRADEAAAGENGIKDELDENIILRNCHVLVGEWIPFGANQIVALNDKLGAADRCQGGMFTGALDSDPTSTSFKVPVGLTSVTILDYDSTKFINFEAEINYPEDEGIVQVENFGMHYNVSGMILYGLLVEAILDRKADDISVDMLSRLLVDVHQDSSKITESLISAYQSTLIECAYLGDHMMRDKYNMLICDGLEPKMEASRYLDGEDCENELRQVLGDTRSAHNLTPDDVLVKGAKGMLIVGPNARKHENLLVLYISLLSRSAFTAVFFTRVFILGTSLKQIRKMINEHEKDPTTVNRVRKQLSEAARDIILMTETLGYLDDSLAVNGGAPQCPPNDGPAVSFDEVPQDLCGKELHKILECNRIAVNLRKRVADLSKNVQGCSNELSNLSRMTEVINTKQLEDVYKGVEKNTKILVDGAAARERASASLEVMQIIFAASMAFAIIDKYTAMDLNLVDLSDHQTWIVNNLMYPPGVWFIFNMAFTGSMCYGLTLLMAFLGDQSLNYLTFEVVVNEKIDTEAFEEYLATKELSVGDASFDTQMKKGAVWEEDDEAIWQGAAPAMEVVYDFTNGFLLSVAFTVDKKRNSLNEMELKNIFMEQLELVGCLNVGK